MVWNVWLGVHNAHVSDEAVRMVEGAGYQHVTGV